MKHKIMIVDDEPANLRLLERLFRRDYQVVTAQSGEEALRLLEQHDAALLITDQRMPGMTGIELLRRTAVFRPHMVRIILTGYTDIQALVEAINCGHVYRYVAKPWNNDDLRATVERAAEHYESNRARYELEIANRRLSARLQEMTQGVVRAIADAVEAKDEYVYGHARRVGGYAAAIGRRMRLDVQTLERISLAALLHDVGKIATPDEILQKPGELTDEERAVARTHPERGARVLAGVPELEDVATIVRHHHERWDGAGYPDGLAREMIPLASRVIRVADAYDSMTSPRPFREGLTHEAAVERLREGAGTRFDPGVVEAFCGLRALSEIRRHAAEGLAGGARLSAFPPADDVENLAFAELLDEVESEPALAARVLRELNAGRDPGSPAVDLREACVALGEARLRAFASQHLRTADDARGAADLWEHSLRTAAAAQLLAEQTGVMDARGAYTLGLLHDAGEVLLRQLFPEEMENILWFTDGARIDREVAAFGVDHAQVGRWIVEASGLPREMASAVQTHHDAMRINSPVALLLHVADLVARASDSSELAALDALGSDRLAPLGLARADLARIHERAGEAVEHRWSLTTSLVPIEVE